jgi:hypothetical protein
VSCKLNLEDSGLVLTVSTVETRKACASSVIVVTKTTPRAITSSFVTVTVQRIGSGWALLKLTGRSSVTGITEATNVLHVIPRGIICSSCLGGKVLLRPASTTVITVIRACRTLASNTIISSETLAGTGFTVTGTLVGALNPRVEVIGVDHITNPGEIARTCAKRAIRTSPLCFAIKTSETFAVGVLLACTVVGTVVLTETTVAMTTFVPCDLSPTLIGIGGGTSRSTKIACITITNKFATRGGKFV